MYYQLLSFLFLILTNYINSNINVQVRLNNSKVPKISIIIPIYNMEKYLNECLDSVISQTLKDIEIICINDGSIDNSLAILKEYEKKDKRIKVISHNNKGVSATKNEGLKITTGEYIIFVAPDDFLDLNIYEKCIESILEYKHDILVYQIHFEYFK